MNESVFCSFSVFVLFVFVVFRVGRRDAVPLRLNVAWSVRICIYKNNFFLCSAAPEDTNILKWNAVIFGFVF